MAHCEKVWTTIRFDGRGNHFHHWWHYSNHQLRRNWIVLCRKMYWRIRSRNGYCHRAFVLGRNDACPFARKLWCMLSDVLLFRSLYLVLVFYFLTHRILDLELTVTGS